MEVSENRIRLSADSALAVQTLIDKLRASLMTICELKEEKFSLEDLFMQVVNQARAEAAAAVQGKGSTR
jgi:regulator of sigma D